MNLHQNDDPAMLDAEKYFSRLHLYIPAQRKSLPEFLQNTDTDSVI